MTAWRFLLAALAGLSLAAAPPAQDRPAAPPLGDEPDRLVPGFSVTFESRGATDVSDARIAALYVPEGSPPTPFLPPGPFKATWEGFVSVDLGTDCVFSAAGTGSLAVTINEKPALEAKGADFSKSEGKPVLLKKGRNRLKMTYESPEKGDSWVRLFWVSADFPLEPVGPQASTHNAAARELRLRRRLREGRELFALRRCAKCHATEHKAGMPELEMDAPSLAEAGARLNPAWVAKWVRGPRAIRPEATMPHLADVTPEDARDLAAFLATAGSPEPAPAPPSPETVKAGGQLFAELRCIGCHTLPENPPAPDRIPYRFLKAKFQPAALKKFLFAPDKHYAWIEMPNFRLTDLEATNLAAFLLSRKGEDVPPAPAGDAARGKERFQTLGCLSCHQGPGTNAFKAAPLKEIPPEGWSRGCMAEKERGKAPDFGFTPAQRAALLAFAATDLSALSREAPSEFAERQIRWLRCQACHKRDNDHDTWFDVAGETKDLLPPKKEDAEFATPAAAEPVIPSLTWTGEKLKPEWAVAFVRGEIKERPRPYLGLLRMPSFTSRAEPLVRGLAFGHGYPASAAPEPEPNPELSAIGRKLSGPNGGLDCVACHGIGPKAATKVFEAPAPNFKMVRARIRRDYFERWVRSPLRVEPGTKMPQFIKEGRTALTEILDGDGDKQVEAIWHYLLEGEKIRPPEE